MSDLETISPTTAGEYDVAIMGGGLAGLTLALQLKKARPTIKILVVEKQKHPVPEAAHKVGESTVEIAAKYFLDLGLQEHLQTEQLRKFGLRFFFKTEDNKDITRRMEIGLAKPTFLPSFQLDRGRLENALGQKVQEEGITFLDECKVEQLTLAQESTEQGIHHLRIRQNKQELDVQAGWVVDATGRSSVIKRQLGLVKDNGHNVNAVWFRVARRLAVDEWSQDPVWKGRVVDGSRYLSTVHMCGDGYWVWLIPLASGSTSVGIVTDAELHPFNTINLFERAMTWLHEHEPQVAEQVELYRDEIQDFRVLKNYSYSARQVYSSNHWCLTGEAGVFLDPLYSPGSDFIAMSNTLITDLITRNLAGEDIRERARTYNLIYLNIATSSTKIYENQYPLLGNTQVFVAKYIWDSATYWGNFSQLFYHDKMCSLNDNRRLVLSLQRSAQVDTRIQAFFREWAAIDNPIVTHAWVDHYNPLDFMKHFHASLEATFTDEEFDASFAENIRLTESIAGCMVKKVIDAYAAFTGNEAVEAQVRRWQADRLLAELITVNQEDAQSFPINDEWVYVASQRQPEAVGSLA